MSKNKALTLCCFFLVTAACSSDTKAPVEATNRTEAIVLENSAARLTIDPYGGAYTEFIHLYNPLNPLSWALTPEQMPKNNGAGAPFKGHFLCLGRWGSPSPGEIAAGIPHNGEPSNTMWKIVELADQRAVMENEAPLDGLAIRREVQMAVEEPVFTVTETIRNTNSLGRPNNIVQHVTLGPPFLSADLIVETNATKGFNQKICYPNPHRYEYEWPHGLMDTLGTVIDLRLTSLEHNYVSSHIFNPEDAYGWITAYNPTEGLLLGYVWRLDEYSWLNVWNHQENGQPIAKGLEFGTTGIGRPYQDLLERDTRFHGRHSWEYLDAGAEAKKSFLGFLLPVGTNARIGKLSITNTEIQIPLARDGAEEQVMRLRNAL